MKISYVKKSQITRNRIDEIKVDLNSYQESIELLHGYAEGRLTIKGGDYCDRAAFIKRKAEDDERYHSTLKNLRMQILLLEHELETLMRYGA